jgi:hypothetical protein
VFQLINSQVTIEWKACPNKEKEIKNIFQIPYPLSTSQESPNFGFSKYVTLCHLKQRKYNVHTQRSQFIGKIQTEKISHSL